MKNCIWFCFLLLLVSTTALSQKKKPVSKTKTETKVVSAKFENCVAELQKNQLFFFQNNASGKRDTIAIKTFDDKLKPENLSITAFTAGKSKLYVISWDEITSTNSDIKKEVNNTKQTVVIDMVLKKIVHKNYNTVINITETIYLDASKLASETREKIQRAGQEFIVNPDGTITLKNKAKQTSYKYDANARTFIAK